MRVVVPFGRGRRLYTGIVRRISTKAPQRAGLRSLLSVLDEEPSVLESQMDLWERIASHYMCTLGEVMAAAMPAQLLLSSETRIMLADTNALRSTHAREHIMLQALEQRQVLTLNEAGELLGLKDPMGVLKRMLGSGVIGLEEELKERYVPRTEKFVVLAEASALRSLASCMVRQTFACRQATGPADAIRGTEPLPERCAPTGETERLAPVQRSLIGHPCAACEERTPGHRGTCCGHASARSHHRSKHRVVAGTTAGHAGNRAVLGHA